MSKKINLKGEITSNLRNVNLADLTVELYDQNQKVKGVIARTKTDRGGEFSFELNPYKLKRQFQGANLEVFLIIKKGDRLILSTLDEIVLKLTKDRSGIKIPLSKQVATLLVPEKRELPKLKVQNLLKIAGITEREINAVENKLRTAGFSQLKSILAQPDKLTSEITGMNKKTLGKFKAATKFAAASASETLTDKLIKKNFLSFNDIGAISKKALEARVGKLNDREKLALDLLYRRSSNIRNATSNRIAFASRLSSRDGHWQIDPNLADIPSILEDNNLFKKNICSCQGCKNAFSPYAYLINLLDMIHNHWQLAPEELEKVLLQNINDLDCDKAYECFWQIELAIEILEKDSRINLPLNNVDNLKANVESIWARLLFDNVDNAKNIDLLRKLRNTPLTRITNLLSNLLNPNLGLQAIKSGFEELKSDNKIQDLETVSKRYARAGKQFEADMKKAYQEVLLLYREALINSISPTVEQLQQELFIDLKAGVCHKTNRLTFLILSLQSFILSARTGKLKEFDRPDVESVVISDKIQALDLISVDEASWKWMKDYPSWASAMYVFLYPENVVIPFLGKDFHEAFTNARDNEILNAVETNQEIVKTAYLNMIGEIIGGDLVKSSNIRNINSNSSLHSWLREIDTSMSDLNKNDLLEEKIFLEQKLYFPLMAAWALNRSENYAAAHDWYRQLYDPTQSGNNKFVFDFDSYFSGDLSQGEEWHNEILDPEAIANRREGVMLRYVILMMVKNLLDWANYQFALATTSSLDRARQLYELAQEVLDSPDLANHCLQSIRELTIEIVTAYGLDPKSLIDDVVVTLEDLNQIDDPDIILEALNAIRKTLPDDGATDPLPWEQIKEEITLVADNAIALYQENRNTIKLSERVAVRNAVIAKYEDHILQVTASQNNNDSGVSPFYSSSGVNIASLIVGNLGTSNEIPYTNSISFCVPPNPLLVSLDSYIKLSLLKFQLCLDITGEPLPSVVINDESVAEFFDTVNAEVELQPLVNLPATWFNEPPRYRYSYLIEKARQYTDLAQRIGSALFAARENYDNAKFELLKAQHAIELTSSTIDLRNLGLKDAVTGLELANLQLGKAETQLNFWQQRIDEGLSTTEMAGLTLIASSAAIQIGVGALQAGPIAYLIGLSGFIGGALTATGAGAKVGAPIVLGSITAAAAAAPIIAQGLLTIGGGLGTAGNLALTYAGFERRFEDWNLQRDLSDFDLRISEVQKESANNRIDIADQELSIAKLQNTQAKEILTFLENKFSNDHLYEWMIQVLSQNYKTLMQISANIAKQAQRALEFERQEPISIISGDYWSVTSVNASSANLSETQKKSGLLGVEKLLTDLTRLDAYKLSTETRRLQLSKSISMAQMLPGELAELKTSGKVTFNTLMNWFDRDFPGHYLRLIKSVKISMLALTPPVDGIHGMLSNSGESTVIISEGANFNPIRSFRNFGESIALDSPFNETGLFVFNYEDPMFLPFEGLGVETQWVLELPQASNRFNFDTLVDVMLTIEYTALHSDTYAQTVREQLGNSDTNDIPINVRLQFPDEWYHFKNDSVTDDGTRQLNIQLSQQFLPPHYKSDSIPSTKHVTVMLFGDFDRLDANLKNQLLESIQIEHDYNDDDTLKLTSQANPTDGAIEFRTKLIQQQNSQYALFSSRDNDNPFFLPENIDPKGDWKISIIDIEIDNDNNVTLGKLIEDILIVITTEGDVNWE